MIDDQTIIEQNPNLLTNTIDDEVVMLNLEDNNYYGIDTIGGQIWQMIEEEPKSIQQICLALMEEYDVTEEQCKKDVISFVEKMQEIKIIMIQNATNNES